jgi:hypothetical protein
MLEMSYEQYFKYLDCRDAALARGSDDADADTKMVISSKKQPPDTSTKKHDSTDSEFEAMESDDTDADAEMVASLKKPDDTSSKKRDSTDLELEARDSDDADAGTKQLVRSPKKPDGASSTKRTDLELDVVKDVIYMIDVDMPAILSKLYDDFIANFKMKQILPGGKWCMMNAVSDHLSIPSLEYKAVSPNTEPCLSPSSSQRIRVRLWDQTCTLLQAVDSRSCTKTAMALSTVATLLCRVTMRL